MLDINETNKDGILAKEGLIMVKVGGSWCQPCQHYNKILETLGEKYSIYHMDVDECPNWSTELNIRSIPISIFFKDGVEAKRVGGLQSASNIIKLFNELK